MGNHIPLIVFLAVMGALLVFAAVKAPRGGLTTKDIEKMVKAEKQKWDDTLKAPGTPLSPDDITRARRCLEEARCPDGM